MKRVKTFAIAAALLIGTAAFAQNQDGPQRPQRKQMSAEEVATMRTERMAKSLELTDKQKAEIYKINLESAAEQQKEREEMMKMMQERREKQKAREEATDERMQKILDASQYKKWLKQKQNEQNRGRMGQGGEGRFGGSDRPMGGPQGFGGGFDNGMGF